MEVQLLTVSSESRECIVHTNCGGTPATASWYMIYLAATAIDAICMPVLLDQFTLSSGIGSSSRWPAALTIVRVYHWIVGSSADTRNLQVSARGRPALLTILVSVSSSDMLRQVVAADEGSD